MQKDNDIILQVLWGKVVGTALFSQSGLLEAGRLPEVTLEVYRAEGTGANGEVLRFRNVTKDYAPQIAGAEAENAAVAAGKEGVAVELDKQALEGLSEGAGDVGEIIAEIKYKPSSGVALKANPNKTTTILGNYAKDMKYIVNEDNY